MSSRTYKSGADAKKGLASDALKDIRKAMAAGQVRVHSRIAELARAATPVNRGTMLAAWSSDPTNPQSAADALRPSKVVNTAPHAGIINAGRRRNKHSFSVRRGTGRYRVDAGARQLGSLRAPLGITLPVLKAIGGEVDKILQQEIDKLNGGDE